MQENFLERLKEGGVLLEEGHYPVHFPTPGHSDRDFRPERFYGKGKLFKDSAMLSAEEFARDEVDLIIAPATYGEGLFATAVRVHLAKITERPVQSMYLSSDYPGLCSRDLSGKRVLLVSAFILRTREVRILAEATLRAGGTIIGATTTCIDRRITRTDLGVSHPAKLRWRARCEPIESWPRERCSLCRSNVPLSPSV